MTRREQEITTRVEAKITKKVTADVSARLEAQFAARFEAMFNSRNVMVPPAAQESPHQASNFSVHEDIQVIHILFSFNLNIFS
jgi:hypothetical protein